ncbi:MAG: hypothetical protein Q9214_005473 [Letrouitia sp. 1 TL-2023]
MPPRKSNVSQASANGDEGAAVKEPKEKHDGTNIEDLSLPRTMVQRLAKGVLPPNTQIQKDAITAMSKGATVFVSHVANACVAPSPLCPPLHPFFFPFGKAGILKHSSLPQAQAKQREILPAAPTRSRSRRRARPLRRSTSSTRSRRASTPTSCRAWRRS